MFFDLSDVGSWLVPALVCGGVIWMFVAGFKGNSEVVKNGKIGKKSGSSSSSSTSQSSSDSETK